MYLVGPGKVAKKPPSGKITRRSPRKGLLARAVPDLSWKVVTSDVYYCMLQYTYQDPDSGKLLKMAPYLSNLKRKEVLCHECTERASSFTRAARVEKNAYLSPRNQTVSIMYGELLLRLLQRADKGSEDVGTPARGRKLPRMIQSQRGKKKEGSC